MLLTLDRVLSAPVCPSCRAALQGVGDGVLFYGNGVMGGESTAEIVTEIHTREDLTNFVTGQKPELLKVRHSPSCCSNTWYAVPLRNPPLALSRLACCCS